MKPASFELIRPETVEDAVAFKSGYGADASVLAGGQSLVPMLNFRLARPAALVDLGAVPGLDGIRLEDGLIHVGAMVRQTALEQSEVAVAACPLLREALHHVAHPVIRNRGTVGGTIAHADASAELPTVLVALHGSVVAAGPQGSRTVSARELFDFHLTTSLEPDEILTEVRFPALARGAGGAFVEVARRHGDYALAGVCAIVELDDDSRIGAARLAYSGVAATPVEATEAAAVLVGEPPGDAVFAEAGERATGCVDVIDEEQASIAYRKQLVRTLTRRALAEASHRASTSRGA